MSEIFVGSHYWSIEDVLAVARRQRGVTLSSDSTWLTRIEDGADFLAKLLENEHGIYGVTTGYGDSCERGVPLHLVHELPRQLSRFHGCGLGRILDIPSATAVLVVRLVSLAQGYSGVSLELLSNLVSLIEKDVIPVIPEEGSVGASGDLTPLSYVAAVLMGEREAFYKGERISSHCALAKAGISPLTLRPKEGLALMNGTSVMTALSCFAFSRAAYLARLSARITAYAVTALFGNSSHFDERLFARKPHPGQEEAARWIRSDLNYSIHDTPRRLQDRYSLRCAPHVIGVLVDALQWMRSTIEIEINSVNDNPLVDPEDKVILHGGHFYGGHIAFAMDSLKNLVANIADLLDRQVALLVNEHTNNGLPANLSGARGERIVVNHGFKAIHIATSAWAAEALKLTMPASVFSRSTESHNQDKVSMGTISARDCLRVIELTEQVAAAALLSVTQALALRVREGSLELSQLSYSLQEMHLSLIEEVPLVEEDRPLDKALHMTITALQKQKWRLYE